MKVILTHDVPNLGHTGDVKNVAAGYARNYLIPNGLAMKATSGALREFERREEAQARQAERLAAHAEALAERLSGVTLDFEAKAGSTGRLYGSITTADIADALEREIGERFDRRKHILSDPIRQVGRHVVAVRLRTDVVAEVKVLVKPEGGELPEETVTELEGASSLPEDTSPVEDASVEGG